MYLSNLDERNVYDSSYTLVAAQNEMVTLRHSSGRTQRFIDMISAYGACNFGHNNPEINTCFQDLKADICASFYPEEATEVCDWMIKRLGLTDFEILFQVGGSFAVSTALSLALHHRPGKIVHLHGAFHGLGIDALSITVAQKDFALQNTALVSSLNDQFISLRPCSDDYRKIDWSNVSCFIFEPIQGANGYLPINKVWMQEVLKTAKAAGTIIIADEIQCGYYRHGHFSPAQANGYEPDVFLYSKSLTNGLFPYSMVVYRKNIRENLQNSVYLSHTFQTSALGCYAMKAVAQYLDTHPIDEYCSRIKAILEVYAQDLKQCEIISQLHVLESTLSFSVDRAKAKDIVMDCFREGVLIFTGGIAGDRVRIAPPLTIAPQNLEKAMSIVTGVVEKHNLQHATALAPNLMTE